MLDTTDPADLFVLLYDAMPRRVFRRRALEGWFRDRAVWEVADRITAACLASGGADPAEVTSLCARGFDRHLGVLMGLDEALLHASPWSPSYDGQGMVPIRDRYLRTGRLNAATAGGLLPRRTFPGRPEAGKEKHHHFRVVRVSPEVWGHGYRNRPLPSDEDPWCRPGSEVPVAFVPVLSGYEDLEFAYPRDESGDVRYYSLAPRSCVAERLEEVLDRLDGAGAQLAVLPESCLSDEVYERWRKLLTERRPSRRSRLRWILLGSGPVGGRGNRAVLVDRWTGEELLRQDKLADFSLTDWQVVTWGLPAPDEAKRPGTVLREDIDRDVEFCTLDAFLGRIGVLICESLTRWPDSRHSEVVDSGPSHVLAPVFSKPLDEGTWEGQGSGGLTSLVGSWVMVSNSLATAATRESSTEDPWYSCLVSGPFEDERRSYRSMLVFGRSPDHLTPGVLPRKPEDTGPGRLPTVRSAVLHASWFPELPRP